MPLTAQEMAELADPPFATVNDMVDRYGELSEADAARAATVLEDVSYFIIAELPYGWETREKTLMLLKPITCAVANRALHSRTAYASLGASQMSLTTGQVTQQVSFSNPYGDIRLTQDEKRRLGISRQRITTIDPLIRYGRPPEVVGDAP